MIRKHSRVVNLKDENFFVSFCKYFLIHNKLIKYVEYIEMDYIAPVLKAYIRRLPRQIAGIWDKELLPRLYAVIEDGYTVISNKPSWETVLPLVISLLLIYATILSLYNTAKFVIRTVIFVLKWSFIIALVLLLFQASSKYTGRDMSTIIQSNSPNLLNYLTNSNTAGSRKKTKTSYDYKPRNKLQKSKTKDDMNELINNIIKSVIS